MQKISWRLVGIIGVLVCVIVFALRPSFPTPDKILVFLTFLFMTFGQAKEMLKRFVPFVGLLLVYESFRGLAPHLNKHVNFTWMPDVDRWLFFGSLPTKSLQNVLWHGHVQWYDFALYLPYMLHFVVPLGLGILIWKKRDAWYWRFAATYIGVSFAAFLTFVAFPAAPPWMASDMGMIEQITRVSSHVWDALGVNNFPSVYNKISPNAVAAVPSLHAAYATLFVIFVWRLLGKKWGIPALIYPFCIYFGTVYMGEHYFIDELLGGLYALAGYLIVGYIFRRYSKKTAT